MSALWKICEFWRFALVDVRYKKLTRLALLYILFEKWNEKKSIFFTAANSSYFVLSSCNFCTIRELFGQKNKRKLKGKRNIGLQLVDRTRCKTIGEKKLKAYLYIIFQSTMQLRRGCSLQYTVQRWQCLIYPLRFSLSARPLFFFFFFLPDLDMQILWWTLNFSVRDMYRARKEKSTTAKRIAHVHLSAERGCGGKVLLLKIMKARWQPTKEENGENSREYNVR